MYQYDYIDQTLVEERVRQFRDQVTRRLADQLSEDEFRPLRLQNGLYLQRHAYMLRIAIPYGLISSKQMAVLGQIAQQYDRGYGHFTTRQNIQFNWVTLEQTPDILALLASVQMHAIQTSGNCIRNITSDPFAGVAADEIVDARPVCELLRQWSTLHPEFAYLPRKFKIAICGASEDRAIVVAHDIGIFLTLDTCNHIRAHISVGGGLGRTPILGSIIRSDLDWHELPNYLSAILRVYNRFGRRDNIYKARIKILLRALGVEAFTHQVEEEYTHWQGRDSAFNEIEWQRVAPYFSPKPYKTLPNITTATLISSAQPDEQKAFSAWLKRNVRAQKQAGYTSVILSLKPHATVAPGDVTAEQMIAIAHLAELYSFSEIRVTHEQNLVLADVEQSKLYELWIKLRTHGLACANIGLLTDIIACPGGDFCALANARSIPIANAIQKRFDDLDYLFDLGDISLNISGCINSCGHHHVGNIGILGVDKNGEEWYQITLGGAQGREASLGKVIGPSFYAHDIPDVITKIIEVYVAQREAEEKFIDTFARIGITPFYEKVYAINE